MKDFIKVVVDADAIIAEFITSDVHNKKSSKIKEKLGTLQAEMLYPISAIAEAATFMQRVYSDKNTANAMLYEYLTSDFAYFIDDSVYSIAFRDYFVKTKSQKNTFYDCIIAAIAKKEQAIIFSFDKFYKSLGFILAEDLI